MSFFHVQVNVHMGTKHKVVACSDYIFCCYFSVLFLNAYQIDNNYLCPRSFSESFKIEFERLSYFSVANSNSIQFNEIDQESILFT